MRVRFNNMRAVVTYRKNGSEETFKSDDMAEVLDVIDKIMYVWKGAELISVTNNGQPVPMIMGL